uniref:Immunoglobulin V-set domain-containing protein n=1 Tax=Ornithorhynchus anatinus TaxID=9258 RepID=A0A6I8NG64_ORNAN
QGLIWSPCSVFCFPSLSSVGPADAGVTQTPRYLLVRTGTKVILRCAQNMAHDAMYWYRQDPGQGLRLIRFSSVKGSTEEGDIPQGYLVSREEKEFFPLTLGSANTNQSSLYFCASSVTTALQCPLRPVHEPPPSGGRKQEARRGLKGHRPGSDSDFLDKGRTTWSLEPAGGQCRAKTQSNLTYCSSNYK